MYSDELKAKTNKQTNERTTFVVCLCVCLFVRLNPFVLTYFAYFNPLEYLIHGEHFYIGIYAVVFSTVATFNLAMHCGIHWKNGQRAT